MHRIMLTITIAMLPVLLAAGDASNHWVDEFGTESVVLENPGSVLIVDGKYVAPPYEIERRGLAIYVNGVEYGWDQSDSWPPDEPLGPVLADPGPPPEGALPIPPAEGSAYWEKKAIWLLKTLPYPESVPKLFEVLEEAAAKDSHWTVRWSDEHAPRSPIVIKLVKESDKLPGFPVGFEFHKSTIPPSEWVKHEPMTKERMLESMRDDMSTIAKELSAQNIIYKRNGREIRTGIRMNYLSSLEALMHSPDVQSAEDALESLDGLSPSKAKKIGLILAAPELEARIASLRAEMETVGAHSMAEVEQKRSRENRP